MIVKKIILRFTRLENRFYALKIFGTQDLFHAARLPTAKVLKSQVLTNRSDNFLVEIMCKDHRRIHLSRNFGNHILKPHYYDHKKGKSTAPSKIYSRDIHKIAYQTYKDDMTIIIKINDVVSETLKGRQENFTVV